MDYETFGEHQWKETGIFDFMASLPGEVLKTGKFKFATPTQLGEELQPVSAIQVPFPISWADEERDVTAWVGNEMQDEAVAKLYELETKVKVCGDSEITSDWYKLQNSDHFYYMCTKWFSDGDVHKYFNPYNSPYEAFINYMNVLSDFIIRVDEKYKEQMSDGRKILESTSELGREIKEAATNTVKKTTKKVKKAIDEQKARNYSFEEIKDLSNARIKKLVNEVDIEHFAVALKDAGDDFKDRILPNMTKSAKKEYDKMVSQLKKVSKSDIKKSKNRISEEISKLFSK
jgi:alpha-amylase/alpha-mannosidase (GH57 family)